MLLLLQDMLSDVFTAELPGAAVDGSEAQEPLASAQAPHDINIQLDDANLKVSTADLLHSDARISADKLVMSQGAMGSKGSTAAHWQ